jgi:hypothetical protein
MIPMSFRINAVGLSFCALLSGCASTTLVSENKQAAKEPLRAACIEPIVPSATLPIRIVSSSGAIGDSLRNASNERTGRMLKLYSDETIALLSAHLVKAGTTAQPCNASTDASTARLQLAFRDATVGFGGAGLKTDLTVDARLLIGESREIAWTGSFLTGDKIATSPPLDREIVDAFAANVVSELKRNGWVADKR